MSRVGSAPGATSPPPLAPALKWAGGKRWLLPELEPLYARAGGRARRLCEPFAGALGVSLGLRPTRAALADANPHVINFHREVQVGLAIDLALENDETTYYTHRDAFNALIDAGEADGPRGAALFYYLNRTGFNGLCRFNSKGRFNVPFGRYRKPQYLRSFPELTAAMAGWSLACADFAGMSIAADDFVYADPPYDVQFVDYSAGGFDWTEQERLARWLGALDVPVVASNMATPRIVELYNSLGFKVRQLDRRSNIGARVASRGHVREMLATRNL